MRPSPSPASSVAALLFVAAVALFTPFLVITAAALADAPGVTNGCGAGATADIVAGITLTAEQLGNARTIVSTVAAMRQPAYAATVAIATAYQESRLLNSAAQVDADSQGLFQQRVSIYTAAVAIDPVRSTEAFVTRLVAVPDWASLPLTQAAQAVQRSAFPDAYAAWQPLAEAVTGQLWPAITDAILPTASSAASTPPAAVTSATATPGCADAGAAGTGSPAGSTAVPAGLVIDGSPAAQVAVQFALAQLGKPYVFGAAGPDSFDCSGLVMAAWARAGLALPHYTVSQLTDGTPEPTDLSQAAAGDLVFIPGADGTPAAPGHVGMVIGHLGAALYLIQAPMTGLDVEITPATDWAGQIVDVRHLA